MLAIFLVALFYMFEVTVHPETKLLPEGQPPKLTPVKEPTS